MQFVQIQWQSDLYQRELDLRMELLRKPLGLTFSEREIQEESKQLHFGIFADDNTVVACAVVVPLTPTHVKLRQMAVATGHQRQGVGASLIRSIEAQLRERNIESIELNARDTAIGFYEKLGYQIEGEPFIEVSIPHHKMRKSISHTSMGN